MPSEWLHLSSIVQPVGPPSRQGGSDSVSAKGRRRRPTNRTSRRPLAARQPTEVEKRGRQEEARRYQEALRRKAVRRRYLRKGAYTLILLAAIGALVYGATRPKHGPAITAQERTLLSQADSQAKVAGCGPVQAIPPYSGAPDQAHIGAQVASPPPLSSYSSTPPASGPHDPTPLDAGVYASPPSVYSTIHSLEHGAAIVWYEPSASGTELNSITSFFGDPAHQDHVIVAPYDYPDQGSAGRFPAGKQMVLVAWHHIQECSGLSLAVAFDFVAHYRFPPPVGESYQGDAPEQGVPI